ncbi:MAG: FHA domain-containing protein [Planctomycetales bacterium]|nr:FHA domain-containing protein [Planctomycetales bacterium]
MLVRLTILGGPHDGMEVKLQQLPVTLGREGDRRVPVTDRWASRHHCQLFSADGALLIRDLASKHGTLVNGQRIDETQIDVGDNVTIGLTNFVVSQLDAAFDATPDYNVPTDRPSSVGA